VNISLRDRWNSADLVNRSLYSSYLPSFSSNRIYSRVTRTRSSCAHSTLVYLYGGSIEMSIRRRCLLFRIILKSVSSSVDSTSTTFLILVISYNLQYFPLSPSFSHFFPPPRSLAFPVTPKSVTRKIETSASAWTRKGEWISPLSRVAHLREIRSRYAAKNNGRCMSGRRDFIAGRYSGEDIRSRVER